MIENSRWIKKFEDDLDKKNIFCIYGNIDDNFFYNKKIVSLSKYFKEKLKDVTFYFNSEYFNEYFDVLNEGGENQGEEEDSVQANNKFPRSFEVSSSLGIIKSLAEIEEKYIVIKDPKLFFFDLCRNATISYSLRFLLESIDEGELKGKKIIFVSEELKDFPDKLKDNNPNVSTFYIDFAQEDERKSFVNILNLDQKILKVENEDNFEERVDAFLKLTDRRKLKDIENIMKKAESLGLEKLEVMSPKEIINYYDIGEEKSPWTELSDTEVKKLRSKLEKRVKGQDEAVSFVENIVYRAKLNLNGIMEKYSNRPKGVMFFTGPSGVGKTELAKALTEAVFGDESAFKRFDMSEYKSEESINKFIGSAPGYVGYDEGGQLTNWILQNPYSVILFDEIDKANVKIWDTFLQILEDGRLTDNKGNVGHFSESILIFTSNIGNADIDQMDENMDEEEFYKEKLKEYFINEVGRVEILNRFGENIVVFNHIEKDVFKGIIDSKLNLVLKNINKIYPNMRLEFKDKEKIVEFLLEKVITDSKKFGARLVNSKIEELFINRFAKECMDNGLHNKKAKIIISIEGDNLKFEWN